MSDNLTMVSEPTFKKDYSDAIEQLKQLFGEQLSVNLTTRQQHAHTMTWLENQPPDAVLVAKDKQDVAKAVALCHQYEMPVIAFGIGSSLEGQLNAPYGGLCIDMSEMNEVLQVNNEDLTVTVQPGVTREQLNHYLRDTGLFFPIDPGANATIGGMVATRASGTNAVRYGTMKDVVLALEVVTADGKIIKTFHTDVASTGKLLRKPLSHILQFKRATLPGANCHIKSRLKVTVFYAKRLF